MRLLMHSLLLSSIRALSSLSISHIHVLITLAFLFFSIFILAATALGFKILTTSIGVLIFFGTSSLLSTRHFFVFANGFGFFGGELSLQAFLKLDLFSTVVCAIIFNYVGLRLFRWEFRRC
jgi:hypothetical protein